MKLLRHRITIERATMVESDYGPIASWETVGSVSASIEPLRGRELAEYGLAQSEVSTRIRIRYLAGLRSADRITHGGTEYNVLSVINREMRNIELELMCKSSG